MLDLSRTSRSDVGLFRVVSRANRTPKAERPGGGHPGRVVGGYLGGL